MEMIVEMIVKKMRMEMVAEKGGGMKLEYFC